MIVDIRRVGTLHYKHVHDVKAGDRFRFISVESLVERNGRLADAARTVLLTLSHYTMESATETRRAEASTTVGFGEIVRELCVVLKKVVVSLFVAVFRFFVAPTRKSVRDEVVLVTGSGQGMGRQLSLEFSKLGAVVVLWDICPEANSDTARQIQELGGRCHTFTCDVSNRQEVYARGRQVQEEIGDVYILINNAGVVSGKKLLDIPDEMIERTFNVNLMANFWTVKCFLPSMLRRNHGHVVNLSSSVGLLGLSKLTDYSASKFGVVGFTEVLNYEIVFSGYTGVHTTLVCPSYVKTGMFKGCKMKYPFLLPELEVTQTVSKIMTAILTNQHMICITRTVYFFSMLKSILPVACLTDIVKFLGASNFMDTFVGHTGEQVRNGHGNHNNKDTVEENCAMATDDSAKHVTDGKQEN